MKRFFLILQVLLTSSLVSAQVKFQFSDGIYNESLKSHVESNVSKLLSEINSAEANERQLNVANIDIDEMAANGLNSLWENIHFRCEWNNNVQPCLKDFTGYEIRQIIVLPNIRQVVEHWLLRHPEHADNPERSLVLAKSDGARCPFGFLDQRAA